MTLRLAISTANFLPRTALSRSAVRHVFSFAAREGFCGVEVLVTRCICRLGAERLRREDPAQLFGGPVCSVHEVWNPRDRLAGEIGRILTRRPQSRGMTPYPMDSLFFRDRAISERALFALAERAGVPAVVSQLASPVTERRYPGPAAALQVHPDLGPGGSHLPLAAVREAVERENYAVVLDTHHTRRRVRLHPGGRTEMAPPLAGPDDPSLGGIRRVWESFRDRVRLIHFQPAHLAELSQLAGQQEWPGSLREFREILPELAARAVPIVIEVSAPFAAQALPDRATRFARWGLDNRLAGDIMLELRDRLTAAAR